MTNEELLEFFNKKFNSIDKNFYQINSRLDKMDTRLDNIESRLDNIEEDIEVIKEDCEITRVSTNELVKWVDFNFRDERPFPISDDFDEEIQSILQHKK